MSQTPKYSHVVQKQNLKHAKVVESLHPELVNTQEPFHDQNFLSLYGHKNKHHVNIGDAENSKRRPLIFEEDVKDLKSTFKTDFTPKDFVAVQNNGKERDMKSNIYFDSIGYEDQNSIECESVNNAEPAKMIKPDDSEKKFLNYYDPSNQNEEYRTKSCYQSNYLQPESNNMRATLSYNGITPRLFHNQHHIHFGNEAELQDFQSDDKIQGQKGIYQSISKRSYIDLSSLNKGQKIHSVHEKKTRDPKKVGFLEHYEGLDDGDFLKSVQKKDFGWKDRTFEETEERKNQYIKELRSTHFSLSTGDNIERATTQGTSFDANQYLNWEKTQSFKKIVKSSIPFDETVNPNEIKKNLNSLYRESFTDVVKEAKYRHENRKHQYFNHSEISLGSDLDQFTKVTVDPELNEIKGVEPPAVKSYRPLNLFAKEDGGRGIDSANQSISKSDYATVPESKAAHKRIQQTKEEMRLANQAHFSLGSDPTDYNSCTHGSYTGNKAEKVNINKDLRNDCLNIQHAQYDGKDHYVSEYRKELNGSRLKGFKTYHSTQRSNISNKDNYFKLENHQSLTSHQLSYIAPEYVKSFST